MKENNNVEIDEMLYDIDRLFTEEDIEGSASLWDLIAESVSEVVEGRILYDNDGDTPGEYIMSSRGSGKQSRMKEYNDEAFAQIELGRRYVVEDISNLASLMERFGKTGQSVAEWVEKTYGVSPITGDSTTDLTLLFTDTTEEPVRPKKRGERCDTCSNMTKKELKKYDSCPSCGRSLFALKSRGW